ncbi:MAG: transcriptional repressor NrdR [Clostridia bacterium]|nr:transcriptional repressor NrdR [Clostridia bacterium]
MRCKYCGSYNSKVIDSRLSDDGMQIRRRRECTDCGKRFTTHETMEDTPVYVIKKNGGRQDFDISKVRAGIVKACEKRPVPIAKIDALLNNIENEIHGSNNNEISSEKIGNMVMMGLKDIDDVAYIRYASVYKEFKDVDTFMKIISDIITDKRG